jgi:hypothetical protein
MNAKVRMMPALLAVSMALLSGCPTDPGTDATRQEQIEARWADLGPSYSGQYFLAADPPSVVTSYNAGTLDPAFLADGLNMANFVRFLAYLPDDLVTDATMNEQSQYGALLLGIVDTLDRNPAKPADMSTDDYNLGIAGLQFCLMVSGYSSLAEAVQNGWVRDDPIPTINLGHRRQILNPALQKVGFGHVDGYSVMQSLDASRAGSVSYQFVAWPSRDAFPVEFFPAGTAWCVSLNPALYNAPTDGSVTVSLTRVSNSQTWTLSKADNSYSDDGEYFDVDPTAWGIANCIIFRPDSSAVYTDGERYQVQIAGLSPKPGGATTLSYEVRFFRLP